MLRLTSLNSINNFKLDMNDYLEASFFNQTHRLHLYNWEKLRVCLVCGNIA